MDHLRIKANELTINKTNEITNDQVLDCAKRLEVQ